jgi:type IX secretion system PorP/SprF family membrane protein
MKKYIVLMLICIVGKAANAQLNPLGAAFFQNQYLANPAMAGLNDGLRANIGYNGQWSTVPGSPSAQFITGEGRWNKVGLGISLYADKAGLLKRSRAVATYAYHLPLNANNDQLHFGLSLGALSERLSTEDIAGTISDISAQRFNERPPVLDGDFGMAYTSGKWNIQTAIPNLKNFLKKERYNTANWNTFFTAMSYRFNTDSSKNAVMIEPKVSYRGVRGYDDVIDGGVNVSFASNKLSATAIYHSTNSFSMGMGFNYKKMSVLGMYTSGTSALQGYSSGNFDIGLGYSFR